jgi:uncharacterized OsmC-like protein
MLLEKDKLECMRDRTKKLAADQKQGLPEASFLSSLEVQASQVQDLQIRVQIREHVINVDRSLAAGGDGTAQSATETLLAAAAACLEINWIAYSSAFNLEIKKVTVKIEGKLDQRFVLSGLDIPARLKSMKITSQIVCSEDRERIERVYKKVLQYCPVGGSLHPEIRKEYILDVQPR